MKRLTNEEYVNRAINVHGDKYEYSLVNYINSRTKIKIICKKHGEFEQTSIQHLKGSGCPKCSSNKSIGEKKIFNYLISNNIDFIYQKRFDDCKNKSQLVFDFYLPKHNLLIEYDGIQHYKSIDFFGGDEKLKKRRINDYLKNEYSINNKINLLRIPYILNIYNQIIPTLNFYINKYE